jgi:phage shock protein PspC (stress-responsive transcriptional regulator)
MAVERRLYRLPSVGRLGGICAGIADYLEQDVALVRLAWVVLSIIPGCVIGGIIAYIAAWLVMPVAAAPSHSAPDKRLTRSMADRKLGGVCGGIAEYFSIDATVVRLAWIFLSIFPGTLVLGAAAYLVAWFIMPAKHDGTAVVVAPHTA